MNKMNFPYYGEITKACARRLGIPQHTVVVGWSRWGEKVRCYWITDNKRDKNNTRIDYRINVKDLL